MIRLVMRLQLANWWRDRRLASVLIGSALALVAASAWSTHGDIAQREAHGEAAAASRAQWEGRGAAHPHSMAHFGDFAFRPSGALARLDRGVQARLGKVLRIEGHRQGTPLHPDAARAGTVARFARPDAAFFLQVVLPLLLIFLGAMGVSSDRESGRLRLLLVQGADGRATLWGHFFALWALGLMFVVVVLLASWATSVVLGADGLQSAPRLIAFVFTHSAFLAVVAAAVVASSVWSRTGQGALLLLLVCWVAGTAVLPRATSSAANAMYPLPSRDVFEAEIKAARETGPDGHNPKDQFVDKRRKEILEEYGVKTVKQLPINFGGIAMQLDEDFANQIWDEHHGKLEALMVRQSNLGSWGALLNPFQLIDHLSMTVAGTDLLHDLSFLHQAESYRRRLIGALNHEHAYGGSKTGDRSFKATPEFFAGIEPFRSVPPALSEVLLHRFRELGGLLAWFLFLAGALSRGGARLERGSLGQ